MPPVGILHVPHASTAIPSDLRPRFLLPEALLDRELLRMTDRWTDDLFSIPPSEATTIRFPVSRLVVDPERFVDDSLEPMAARGMGVIYTRTADGLPLRSEPAPEERDALITRFYRPHHEALAAAVQSAVGEHGRCLIVDCHSFPSVALPCDLDQSPGRPDICIGTDSFHTPDRLASEAVDLFAGVGLSVAVNRPYAGSLVPLADYGRKREVSSIMIEVNRRLYMDEASGGKLAAFDGVAEVVRRGVRELLFLAERLR